jgi:hypothetical protein
VILRLTAMISFVCLASVSGASGQTPPLQSNEYNEWLERLRSSKYYERLQKFRLLRHPKSPRPIDDFHRLGPLAQEASLRRSIGIVAIQSALQAGCWIYEARVTVPLWNLREGQNIAFVERIRAPDEDSRFSLHPQPPDSYPKMRAGETYFVTIRAWGDHINERHVRAAGLTLPVVELGFGATISVKARDVTTIIPDLQQLLATQRLPELERPAALRR